VPYNFQTGKNKIKLLKKFNVYLKTVLFCNAILEALMSGRQHDVILQNGDSSRESIVPILVLRNKVLYQNSPSL
jgi:hypothetical protein